MRRWLGTIGMCAAAAAVALWLTRRSKKHANRASEPADVRFMYAMHNAFRRDLTRLERVVRDPASSRGGWAVFREELEFHHGAEDDDLWPDLRARITDPDDQRVIDEMTTEHAQIPPLLAAVEDAFAGRGELEPAITELARLLRAHLEHEEQRALPIVEECWSNANWHDYMDIARRRRGPEGGAQFLCWVLDDATVEDERVVLPKVPAPGRLVYRLVMKPRYDARNLWGDDARRRPQVPTSEPAGVSA